MTETSISSIAMDVAEQAVDAAQQAKEAALDAWQEISDRVSSEPKKKHHTGLWLFLGLLAIGAAAFIAARKLRGTADQEYGAPPDAFGEAVTEERAASGNGRATVPTPGA